MDSNVHRGFLDGLVEAEKLWKSADHFVYVTLPVVKDERLLARALENLHSSVVLLITTVLKIEYYYKRVQLTKNPKKNLEVFFTKCRAKYDITKEEGELIREVMVLGTKHKESGFEFSGKGKMFILDNEMRKTELGIEEMKEYVKIVRKLLENANRNFKQSFRNRPQFPM
tara:strand:+ start:1916 stop:2425 length:510 start_codon:yes stop_codon:yes gene_type:complete